MSPKQTHQSSTFSNPIYDINNLVNESNQIHLEKNRMVIEFPPHFFFGPTTSVLSRKISREKAEWHLFYTTRFPIEPGKHFQLPVTEELRKYANTSQLTLFCISPSLPYFQARLVYHSRLIAMYPLINILYSGNVLGSVGEGRRPGTPQGNGTRVVGSSTANRVQLRLISPSLTGRSENMSLKEQTSKWKKTYAVIATMLVAVFCLSTIASPVSANSDYTWGHSFYGKLSYSTWYDQQSGQYYVSQNPVVSDYTQA
jgi:hypothetical protein